MKHDALPGICQKPGCTFCAGTRAQGSWQVKGKDVLLGKRHITELDAIFKLVNHHKSFRDYPTMLYHGYHQRKVGCFSGSRSLYVDSAGNVHACPFCQNHSYNIIDWIRDGNTRLPEYKSNCPRYGLMT